jgi:hypothetical protein
MNPVRMPHSVLQLCVAKDLRDIPLGVSFFVQDCQPSGKCTPDTDREVFGTIHVGTVGNAVFSFVEVGLRLANFRQSRHRFGSGSAKIGGAPGDTKLPKRS